MGFGKLLDTIKRYFADIFTSRSSQTDQQIVAEQGSTISDVIQVTGEVVIVYAGDKREPFDTSSARQQYLQAIVDSNPFNRWAGDGYIDEHAVLVLLDRPLSASESPTGGLAYADNELRDLVSAVQELLQRDRWALVLGELGIGKTTLLQKLTYLCASEALQKGADVPLPVYVPLDQFVDDVWECLRSGLNETGQLDLTREQAEILLSHGKCLIMFDGLNEMGPHHEDGIRALQTFMANCHQHQFVFTCRTYDYKNELEMDTAVEIRQLDTEGTLTYLIAELGDQAAQELYRTIVADDRLTQLANNPLLLKMIMEVSQEGKLPRNRGRLLQEFVKKLLWREEARHRIHWEIRERALVRLGHEMQEERKTRYPELQVMTCFRTLLSEWNEDINWRDLLNALRADDLLRNDDQTWFYRHSAFQEYFAAVRIAQNDPYTALQCVGDEWWHPVILFLVGIIEDPGDLIAAIAEVDPLFASRALNACESTEIASGAKRVVAEEIIKWVQSTTEPVPEAFDALVDIGKLAVEPLLNACADDQTDYFLDWASDILTEIDEPILHLLADTLQDNEKPLSVRRTAAHFLGEVGDESIIPVLVPALGEDDPEIVGEAIGALGKVGDEGIVELLAEVANMAECREGWEGIRDLVDEALDEIKARERHRDVNPE